MDTINERKKTFTFYYTSSILLKGWIERAGSRMKGQVLYKPKHNKTISQQSPDAWLFAFFICCCTDTFVGVYNTIEKCVLVQFTWNRILEFQKKFLWNWLYTFIKPLVPKFIQKAYSWKPGERDVFFLLLRLIFSGCLTSFDLFWIKRLSFKSLPIIVLS